MKFKRLCKNISITKKNEFCIPPYIDYEFKYRIVKKYNLTFCQMDKNLSSTMRMVLGSLILNNGTYTNVTISDESWFKYYYYMKNLRKKKLKNVVMEFFKTNKTELFLKNNKLLAIVRDPIERFISSFTSKCIIEQPWKLHPGNCLKCSDNVTCVIDNVYKKLKEISLDHSKLKYHDYYTQHFVPQTWNCEFSNYQKYYKILFYEDSTKGLEKFYESLLMILKKIGVSREILMVIKKSITTKRSFNATHDKEVRENIKKIIYGNPILLRKLLKIYFNDYVKLNIPFPEKLPI
uniref:Carbohydrate sulfotransferase n=1 Tax=Strongyloides venezuelensis TaxID=75913 RepID=A0A0K0FVG8_STRVS